MGIANGIVEYLDSSLTDLTIKPNLHEDDYEESKAGH